MIEVFEKWFSQFTRPEQQKLLRHIKKVHFDVMGGYPSRLNVKKRKGLIVGSKTSSRLKEGSSSRSQSKTQ
jgi:plastocyanin domain-containing protein